MNKSLLFRLFRAGAVPKELRPVLAGEGIIIEDEGMAGLLVSRNVKGPGKRYLYRVTGFSGSLVVTRKRIICYTYRKRQINISVTDGRLSRLFVFLPQKNTLTISFDSADFQEGWHGVVELRFKTEKAESFMKSLTDLGLSVGTAGI